MNPNGKFWDPNWKLWGPKGKLWNLSWNWDETFWNQNEIVWNPNRNPWGFNCFYINIYMCMEVWIKFRIPFWKRKSDFQIWFWYFEIQVGNFEIWMGNFEIRTEILEIWIEIGMKSSGIGMRSFRIWIEILEILIVGFFFLDIWVENWIAFRISFRNWKWIFQIRFGNVAIWTETPEIQIEIGMKRFEIRLRCFEIWIEILEFVTFSFTLGWKFESYFEFLFEIGDKFSQSERWILKSPIKFLRSNFKFDENVLKLE